MRLQDIVFFSVVYIYFIFFLVCPRVTWRVSTKYIVHMQILTDNSACPTSPNRTAPTPLGAQPTPAI